MRLLLVEDHLAVAKGLIRLLEVTGYTCAHAASAREAIEYLSQHMPHLVICDGVLGDMHSLELIKVIRANPRTQALPLIVFSASIDAPLAKLMLEAGATACCPKPDVEQLLRLVAKALS